MSNAIRMVFDLFERGSDSRMAAWLAMVLAGTVICGYVGTIAWASRPSSRISTPWPGRRHGVSHRRSAQRDRRPHDATPGYGVSQQKRKLVEQGFGWKKTIGGLRTLRHRGSPLVTWIPGRADEQDARMPPVSAWRAGRRSSARRRQAAAVCCCSRQRIQPRCAAAGHDESRHGHDNSNEFRGPMRSTLCVQDATSRSIANRASRSLPRAACRSTRRRTEAAALFRLVTRRGDFNVSVNAQLHGDVLSDVVPGCHARAHTVIRAVWTAPSNEFASGACDIGHASSWRLILPP